MNSSLLHLLNSEEKYNSSETFLESVNLMLSITEVKNDLITSELVDNEFIQEIVQLPTNISVQFGKSLRDLKCGITDDESARTHVLFLKYLDPKKIVVCSVNLPYSFLQDREYKSVKEVATAYRSYITTLSRYLYELECIDNNCTVMEPAILSFKDEFRRIALDDRTWLHIEVTHDGLATNVHLIGQSEKRQEKLQQGLLNWDHDKNIYENVTNIFDLPDSVLNLNDDIVSKVNELEITCGICFCVELPDKPGVSQPLCQNFNCGVYFHKYCLFQWLVACEGGRPPAFGVANGSCPTCLQPIACSEQDT